MIKRTRGNKTGVIIPLFTRTLHEDGTTSVEPFTPSSDDAVIVTLEAARKYNYTPIIGDNCVIFDLSGAEVAGVYSLTVSIARADGSRLRYFTREALELTELSSESGNDETAEFTVTGVELDAAWFFFAKGDTGNGIASVEKTASSGLVDTYTITYTDGTTSTFSVTNGAAGADGRGISNIKKISSVENVDTYRINYTDGSFSLFNVTNGENGAPGRGIVSIKKDSSEGLVDTYEITYTDGTSDFFEVTNGEPGTPGEPGATGNGIVKIEKTATVGLVDTYTIYYTNGTTSTFSVTNGQSGTGGLQRVELETTGDDIHVKGTTTPLTFAEVLALVEDTTKFVTLYDGFNLFLPVYDDEGGAVIFSSAYIQNGSPQITRVTINSAGQIKYETAFMEYANLKTDNLNNEGSEQWRTYPTTRAVNEALAQKQPTLTAGENITIENNVISAVGGGGGDEMLDMMGAMSANGLWRLDDGTMINKSSGTIDTEYFKNNYPDVEEIYSLGNLTQLNNFGMFADCKKLKKVHFRYTDFIKTNYNSVGFNMFKSCESLKEFDIDVPLSSVQHSLSTMFGNCYNLERIGKLSNLNSDNNPIFYSFFGGCNKLQSIDSVLSIPAATSNIISIFYGCTSLKNIEAWENISCGFVINNSPLTAQSVLIIFNALHVNDEYAEGTSYAKYAEVLKDGVRYYCNVNNSSTTWVESEWVATPSTITFMSGLFATYTEAEKAEINAVKATKVAKGWTIVNMG